MPELTDKYPPDGQYSIVRLTHRKRDYWAVRCPDGSLANTWGFEDKKEAKKLLMTLETFWPSC